MTQTTPTPKRKRKPPLKPGGMTRAQSGRMGSAASSWRTIPACATIKAKAYFAACTQSPKAEDPQP
jgi:hypothetical protein